MKVSGAELKAVWDWWVEQDAANEWYVDDIGYGDDDEGFDIDKIVPDEKYDLDDMPYISWQGDGDAPKTVPWATGKNHDLGVSFLEIYRKWKKVTTTQVFVVTVPKERVAEFKSLCQVVKAKIT